MAIELIDKIKPKNNGSFAMVDAEDVAMPDGTRLSEYNPKGGTNWNASEGEPGYVENRTHYKYLPFEEFTVEVDYETAESVDLSALDLGVAYRISDKIIGANGLDGGRIDINGSPWEVKKTDSSVNGVYTFWTLYNVYSGLSGILACIEQPLEYNGVAVEKTGLYIISISDAEVIRFCPAEQYVPLDKRYIPDTFVDEKRLLGEACLLATVIPLDGGAVRDDFFVDSFENEYNGNYVAFEKYITSTIFAFVVYIKNAGGEVLEVEHTGRFSSHGSYVYNDQCMWLVESKFTGDAKPVRYMIVISINTRSGRMTAWAESIKEIDVTAEVGQSIIVKEVNEQGKPTEWEAVKLVTANEVTAIIDEYLRSALEGDY